jgi:demethylmenaquinone methyltransferase/2-methoxy-6-polyprenyl-1,4-benzoquinol methylase
LAVRARVVGLDLSLAMLRHARKRRLDGLVLVQGSAFRLPFPDGTFAAVVSGFVLRNLNDLPRAIGEMRRVSAPGGVLAALDITEPPSHTLRWLFDGYLATFAPLVGGFVGKRDEYRYLVRSLAQLPEPTEVVRLLDAAGFADCMARPLTRGTVTLFTATTPSEPTSGEREEPGF